MAGGDQSGEGASVWRCLMMTMIGAAGTALGGLLVVIRPEMSIQELGLMQVSAASPSLTSRGPTTSPISAEPFLLRSTVLCIIISPSSFPSCSHSTTP